MPEALSEVDRVRVLISDEVDESCVEIFQAGGCQTDYVPGMSADELLRRIGDYEVLIVRSRTRVTAAVLEASARLRIVGRAGAGVDNIDVGAATRRGVIVMNTPGGNTIATAEHTVALMLAMARNIPQAQESLRAGKWERNAFVGTELQGKVLGILGFGKVGSVVAARCSAFGMRILAYDPVQSPGIASHSGVELVGLEELLRQSDIISVHTPLTDETRGLLRRETFGLCKDGVRIINCARGGIVNEQALLEALESGKVAGAALDVFEEEPPRDRKLIGHPHVVSTPHLGASTEEAQEKVAAQIAGQVVAALQGKGADGAVNASIIRMAMRDEIRPYITLAECMGKILAQISDGPITALHVSHTGELPMEALHALSAAAVKGILGSVLSEPVNIVNAPLIARERGITVQVRHGGEGEESAQGFEVEVRSGSTSRKISGAVFAGDDIRITGMDGFRLEIKPEGHLLFYSNPDRPGMLASVSRLLAEANVNIAGLSLGRSAVGKKALTIISTDDPIPRDVLDKLSTVDGVADVKLVSL